ncbi:MULTISPECIES: hypothetical protein [Mycolicibacterium]|jgi:hypothetical protein|uniref:hypothetical protein n=1 Tax=Mycolicibacterium TaxID=1866885 RepID=UPI000A68BB3C|nr:MULTISPECIES: hypothetical protein [Mycolicibacterium]MCC9179489.1 hypothetical protein [Mycolicibacterium mageritense]MCV7211504.1 hypothetical protein [Mycolicibacterium canariasense]
MGSEREVIADTDTYPGYVFVRDAQAELNVTLDARLTPDQARVIAGNLEREGKHTVAAEGLRRAADEAERKA